MKVDLVLCASALCMCAVLMRCEKKSGGVLLSHGVAPAVPSALRALASGFGM